MQTQQNRAKQVTPGGAPKPNNKIYNKKYPNRQIRKNKILGILFAVIAALALVCTVMFSLFVYSESPFFSYWRTIWIETAMSTMRHQWLATAFIPGDKIDAVMAEVTTNDVIGGKDVLRPSDETADGSETDNKRSDDPLDQKNLVVGGYDYAGNKVLFFFFFFFIVVSEIVIGSFKGKIMLVDDPSRVFVGQTPYPGIEGLRIRAMMDYYDAIAGINASGFADPYENGNGGEVVGMSCSNGNYWGSYTGMYGSIVITEDDKLVVGNINIWSNYNIRDGIQFGPVLIADGIKQVEGSAGFGIQPRTAIGQREDGVIVFLVIDGRDVTHSIGCTVGDMADILVDYGVENAACCDGGASSVLAYDGQVITKNCSLNPAYGRPLPNAFLVRRKSDTK